MYRSLGLINRVRPNSFDRSFTTHAQADGDHLRFVRGAMDGNYSMPGVGERIIWDARREILHVTYSLPIRMSGIILGPMLTRITCDDPENINTIGISSVGATLDGTRLVFGSRSSELPGVTGIQAELALTGTTHDVLLSDYFDEFIYPKLCEFTGMVASAAALTDSN